MFSNVVPSKASRENLNNLHKKGSLVQINTNLEGIYFNIYAAYTSNHAVISLESVKYEIKQIIATVSFCFLFSIGCQLFKVLNVN